MKVILYNIIYKILFIILPKGNYDTFIYDSFNQNEWFKRELDNSFYTNSFSLFNLKQISALKGSKIILIDNYYHPLSIIKTNKQVVYQLWHANGAIKKFGLSRPNISSKQRKIEQKQYSNYDFVLSPSKMASIAYQESFGINKEQILKFGYIQMDKYSNYVKPNNDVIKVFYAPTFRNSGDYSEQLNLVYRLNKFSNIDFSYSLHPLSGKFSDVNVKEELKKCDVFISDYSSLILEAMFLEKAVYLHQYDLVDYTKNEGIFLTDMDLPSIKELDFKNLIISKCKYNEYNKFVSKKKLLNSIENERNKK